LAPAVALVAGLGAVAVLWGLIQQNRLLKDLVATQYAAPPTRIEPGATLANTLLIDPTGNQVESVELYAEKRGVVAFLTGTCQSCEDSLAEWATLAKDLEGRGLAFHAVVFGSQGEVFSFEQRDGAGVSWWIADLNAAAALGVDAVPMTALYERGGSVVNVWRGELTRERREALLRSVTAQSQPH
jgi:hypothetical protein